MSTASLAEVAGVDGGVGKSKLWISEDSIMDITVRSCGGMLLDCKLCEYED